MKRGEPIPPEVKRELTKRCKGRCEARLIGCTGKAQEPHHVKSRGRGGSNNLGNLLGLCNFCHERVTNNKPGTSRFRTYRFQEEGETEADFDAQFPSET